ncbi:MAG: alpha-glucuronidase [Clostridia bacterium]|nr:alpha-glucuronidase [Clostridia bacterium]
MKEMAGWENRRAWLQCLKNSVPDGLDTPLAMAKYETEAYFAGKQKIEIRLQRAYGDGYEISKTENGFLVCGGETGVLYGAYALIRACAAGTKIPAGIQKPYYDLRMINCWDNMDGTVERGYAGRSMWFEGNRFDYDPTRIRQLGRMLGSVGINVFCVNNVNVHQPAQHLLDDLLPDAAAFAALLRPFGVRLMLSIDFSQPMQNGLPTADPLDESVQAWWADTAKRVWAAIPDLAGFLVKADSEHRPGPNTYGRTHAEGANMLARAIAPYGGKLVWRAFVYNCMQDWRDQTTDRPRAAYDLYKPLDGAFDSNVILQVKHGPYDFQVREPVSPLLLGMEKTPLAVEFQLAQEYTGHQIDLYYMGSLWRETFDQMGKERVTAIAAVSNLGRDANWTGHPFAAANLFAYGLFAWNPDSAPEAVLRQWVKLTYALPEDRENALASILLQSRAVYERYTAPLGLCWMVTPNSHYGPSPYGYEFQAWGTYNRADRNAVGIDRTKNGTGYVEQYPEPWRSRYADPQTCPDNLLLFFHRLPYDFQMKDGRTLIQRVYDDHFLGYDQAEQMAKALAALDLPSPDREEAARRMEAQLQNAREWRDITNTFFHRLSGAEDERGRKIYD